MTTDVEYSDGLEYEIPQSAQQPQFQSLPLRLTPPYPLSDIDEPETDSRNTRQSSDPPDPRRPNKYNGPASTWRSWTAADRDIAQSLDKLKNRNLSVHLYNAHRLKIRAQNLSRGDKDAKPVWIPPSDWTAWPLAAEDVPRSTGSDAELTRTTTICSNTREDLKELLLAHMTKSARERFQARDCEGCDGNHTYETKSSEIPFTTLDSSDTSIASREGSTTPSSTKAARPRSKMSHVSPLKRSSSAMSNSSYRSRKRRRDAYSESYFEPVPIADDDKSMQIARPSIEHALSGLDRLLGSLHTTRQHYFKQPGPKSKPRNKKITKSASKNKRRSTQISDESSSETDREEDDGPLMISNNAGTATRPRSQSHGHQSTFLRYGQRDWKDVLGLAAILGFDENAIKRAQDRCSALFDESMQLPSLNHDSSLQTNDNESGTIPNTEEIRDIASEDEMYGGVHVDGFLKPIKRRPGWRGRNKAKGNWKSRAKEAAVAKATSSKGKQVELIKSRADDDNGAASTSSNEDYESEGEEGSQH